MHDFLPAQENMNIAKVALQQVGLGLGKFREFGVLRSAVEGFSTWEFPTQTEQQTSMLKVKTLVSLSIVEFKVLGFRFRPPSQRNCIRKRTNPLENPAFPHFVCKLLAGGWGGCPFPILACSGHSGFPYEK